MSLSRLFLATFLFLVAATSMFEAPIPGWVIGLVAGVAGVLLLVEDKLLVRR